VDRGSLLDGANRPSRSELQAAFERFDFGYLNLELARSFAQGL